MSLGRISVSLPFIRKKGVELLRTEYASSEDAAQKIPAALREYYRQTQPALCQSRSADIDGAANTLVDIYRTNVFPDLKVTWGTYKNNLGHTDFPGCFRCHDELHSSADQKTISQDCGICHELVSTSEASPAVLQTLGVEKRLLQLQKK